MIATNVSGLHRCRQVALPKITDRRGSLSVVEGGSQLGFEIKRVYYLYDVPEDQERGAHGHRELQQLFIPLAGSFDILLDDGREKRHFHLSNPACALFVGPMIWRELSNFTAGAVCLVLASMHYDERDYFRDYADFHREARFG